MSFFIPVVLTLLLSMSALAAAQEFDCNCSPVSYTFQLKLGSIACPDPPEAFGDDAVAYFGPGVNEAECDPTSGLPVRITSGAFAVADPNEQVVAGDGFEDFNWVDGDTLPILFESPNTNPPLVRSIGLLLKGETADGTEVENFWSVWFTNECGELALQEGTELGWVVFKKLERPSQAICPRPGPSGSMSLSYSHSYSYATTFSKAGKVSKRSRNGKSGKNGGRRILQTEAATSTSSVNAKQGGLPTLMTTKDASVGVEKEGQNDEGMPLRRRRLDG